MLHIDRQTKFRVSVTCETFHSVPMSEFFSFQFQRATQNIFNINSRRSINVAHCCAKKRARVYSARYKSVEQKVQTEIQLRNILPELAKIYLALREIFINGD